MAMEGGDSDSTEREKRELCGAVHCRATAGNQAFLMTSMSWKDKPLSRPDQLP
jgi:hypothetical protein